MPTFQNNGSGNCLVTDKNGERQSVAAGETVEAYERLDLAFPDLAKTLDTPYYNPIHRRHSPSSTGADKTINLDVSNTKDIHIWKVADATISVFYESADNVPAVSILRPGDQFIGTVYKKVSKLVLQFSAAGSCEILESLEDLS